MIRISLLAALCLCATGEAFAQSLSPMRAKVVSFGDYGAVRASLRNPYAVARRFDIEIFTSEWEAIDKAKVSRKTLALAPGASTSIMAFLPVPQQVKSEDVFLCVTSRAFGFSKGASLRGQVCGRYRIIRGQY